jgi:predicted nucleic acid-binding protein
MMTQWIKGRFFDASALVKLVVDEPDSDKVREFVNQRTNLHTNFICYAEAFGVLKRKWVTSKGVIAFDTYFAMVLRLISGVRNKFQFDEMELLSPTVQGDIERLGNDHHLDLADALQLVTILTGTYSHLGPESATVLVTADFGLAEAARQKGVRVWRVDEPVPDWA